MSVDYSATIGPYLECLTLETMVPKVIRCCYNLECKTSLKEVWDSTKVFCSVCGKAIEKVTVQVPGVAVDAWKLQETIDETLFCANNAGLDLEHSGGIVKHIWLPNQRGKGYFNGNVRDMEGLHNLTTLDIQDVCVKFAEQFEKEIAVLNEAYEARIRVQWGIVCRAN